MPKTGETTHFFPYFANFRMLSLRHRLVSHTGKFLSTAETVGNVTTSHWKLGVSFNLPSYDYSSHVWKRGLEHNKFKQESINAKPNNQPTWATLPLIKILWLIDSFSHSCISHSCSFIG
eukprot:sb/3476309/